MRKKKGFNWYPFVWLSLPLLGLLFFGQMPKLSVILGIAGIYFFTTCLLLGIRFGGN